MMVPISSCSGFPGLPSCSFISRIIIRPSALQYNCDHCKRLMAMLALSFLMMMLPISTSLTCPTSCSTLSPLPYPFGAAPGCGLPGFQMTNCSISPPQWNLTVAGYTSSYYIKSISSNPEYSSAQTGTNPNSYGQGGTALVYLNPTTDVFSFCEILNGSMFDLNDFTTSNLYAFVDANLTYYQDSYLFLNCSAPYGKAPPDSGVLNVSSPSCMMYINHCNLSSTGSCIEYIPDKQLQLATLKATYGCSTLRRFVIADENAPISSWISLTQFAWGPVKDAASCTRCQKTGGTCGYNTEDESFLCYCGDKSYQTDCKSGHLKAIVIGASLAAILILILAGIAFYYRHECYYCGVRANRQVHLKLDGINQAPLELSYWALSAATKSFSTQIGQGAFGKVYRGLLNDGSEVAVKVLDPSVSHTDEQFLNEVATIGNIHHMNIARLVGFCFRKSRRILVYEFVSNGSLDMYLFAKKQAPGVPVLNWKQRFDIALGIARGLSYMHEECRNCIIHCDIKPQNILLDDAFCPKIADFGLARLLKREESRVLTHARGTPGYVAPEFWSLGSGPLSAKFDVYSYGMVLLEIIRGRRSFEEFDAFFQVEAVMNSFDSVSIDKRIKINDADLEQAHMCTTVAFWCIQEDPSMRPKMSRVVQYLLGTAAVPEDPPKPFKASFCNQDLISEAQQNSSEFLLKYSHGLPVSHPLSRD